MAKQPITAKAPEKWPFWGEKLITKAPHDITESGALPCLGLKSQNLGAFEKQNMKRLNWTDYINQSPSAEGGTPRAFSLRPCCLASRSAAICPISAISFSGSCSLAA